ncbi:MAG TPA: hypothetical protein GX699_04850 [Firmicutes bacterium]|nr:hypothetical protein [Bacillota bacterium]
MNDLEQARLERRQMMDDVINNRQPTRVPVLSACSTWAYYYKGYKPLDGLDNDEVLAEVSRAIYTDFYWDVVDIGPAVFHHPDLPEILGGGTFTFNQEGLHQTRPGAINVMEPEEYPELIKDPYAYILNYILPRRYALFAPDVDFNAKYEGILKVFAIRDSIARRAKLHDDIAEKEFGLFNAVNGLLLAPVDFILDYLRDFSGVMQDIKRRPEAVRDAGMALVQYSLDGVANVKPEAGKTLLIPMHLPTFLNPRDFEKVYWPSYKALVDTLVARGHIVKCAFERKYEHLFDFLQDLPKNKTVGVFEDDDIRLVKKKLGDTMAIQGGLSTQALYYAGKEECLDIVKGLIDDLAPGGGYIFGTNKSMIHATDGNPENLKAVNEFVREYGVYR